MAVVWMMEWDNPKDEARYIKYTDFSAFRKARATMIEVQNVTKTLNGRTILSGVHFEVEDGEIFGLLGLNSAGKTTTLRTLLGLLKPTSGQTLLFDAHGLLHLFKVNQSRTTTTIRHR